MSNHLNPDYLPHRRQRYLNDNQDEFYTLFKGNQAGNGRNFDPFIRAMVLVVAIISGISTIVLGEMLVTRQIQQARLNSAALNVAGVRTEIPYDEPIETPTPRPIVVCWNQVKLIDEELVWDNSCRGLPPVDFRNCQAGEFPLTKNETKAYTQWFVGSKSLDVSCQAQAGDIPRRLPANPDRFR